MRTYSVPCSNARIASWLSSDAIHPRALIYDLAVRLGRSVAVGTGRVLPRRSVRGRRRQKTNNSQQRRVVRTTHTRARRTHSATTRPEFAPGVSRAFPTRLLLPAARGLAQPEALGLGDGLEQPGPQHHRRGVERQHLWWSKRLQIGAAATLLRETQQQAQQAAALVVSRELQFWDDNNSSGAPAGGSRCRRSAAGRRRPRSSAAAAGSPASP